MKALKTQEELKEEKAKDAKRRNLESKIKSMQVFEERILKDLENLEKSSALKMRDRAAWYENHVKKMVYVLRKEGEIEEKKKFKEEKEKRVKKTKNILGSIDNFYKDRVGILKDQVHKEQRSRKTAEYAQRQMLSELERELRAEKKKQMEEIIQKSMQERRKHDEMINSHENINDKLYKIFQSNLRE